VSPSTTAAVASSPKLLDRVRWHLRVKHYSIRTEQAYVDWIRRYILFHRKRHPNEMSEKEITEFLRLRILDFGSRIGNHPAYFGWLCAQTLFFMQ
jgi:Phage integrase, N-terminal SAM-like domain